MTKLEQLKRKIIMLNHPECEDYHEAYICFLDAEFNQEYAKYHINTWKLESIKVITLTKVIKSLWEWFSSKLEKDTVSFWELSTYCFGWWTSYDRYFDRKLSNKDWSDATLDDQSEETIDALYNLLCWYE